MAVLGCAEQVRVEAATQHHRQCQLLGWLGLLSGGGCEDGSISTSTPLSTQAALWAAPVMEGAA